MEDSFKKIQYIHFWPILFFALLFIFFNEFSLSSHLHPLNITFGKTDVVKYICWVMLFVKIISLFIYLMYSI